MPRVYRAPDETLIRKVRGRVSKIGDEIGGNERNERDVRISQCMIVPYTLDLILQDQFSTL